MQINKELLERALVEGVDCSYSEKYINLCVSLATDSNEHYTGFYLTDWQNSTSSWTYVCNHEEYLKAKAEKEKMNEFKVGDLVDVVNVESMDLIHSRVALKYISDQWTVVSNAFRVELMYVSSNIELKPHRKTQDWFGVEIDAFMAEKPKTGAKYWFFSPSHEMELASYSFNGDVTDGKLFSMGVWDSEEKAQRSVPLMRQRLIEMAGVSCKEK